ncbi:hypothetical protein GCM10028807_19960 [Spirosoma daeguense]
MEPFSSTNFPAADKANWLKQVQRELKSEDAYETLRWHTPEEFTLEPYYTLDDLASLPLEEIQSAQKQVPDWLNAPAYNVFDEKATNETLRDALNRGADALIVSINSGVDLSRLLNGIKLSETPVFFQSISPTSAAELVLQLKAIAPYQIKGGLLTTNATAETTRQTADSPQFRTVHADGTVFHNAGATATQELAFTLASLVDTYDALTDAGLTIEQLVPKTIFSVAIGTSYFLEIAKLRALRVLFRRLVSHYSPNVAFQAPFIHAQTSTFYDAIATPYTNLLRSTTEAMAAVVGGCDALTVHPYNTIFSKSASEAELSHAERIARNVSILLKSESYLDKVADPSAGSYYVENATYQLVNKAWTLFLVIEKQGGFAKALASGFVQTELNKAYEAKREAVRQGNVIVGVTKFRSDDTKAAIVPNPIQADAADLLPKRRLAETFE